MSQRTRRAALTGAAALCAGAAQAAPSSELVASLRAPAAEAVESGELPGVVSMVWRKGELISAEAVGLRDIARQRPMERSTIFRIASMSKPITVTAAMTLMEQGRMRLSDPITRWAPEFANMRVLRRADGPLDDTYPAPRAITVEDLMTHRSGLSYGFLASGPLAPAITARTGMGIESALTPEAWMKSLAELPLAYAPGERFNYGHSIDVLGFIVGRAAGTNLRQVMQATIFGPLGMTDTDFWIPPEKRDREAIPYLALGPKRFAPVPLESFLGATAPAYTSGGQGLASTADDYMTFARMLMGEGRVNGVRVLKPATVRSMTTNRLTASQRQLPFLGMPYWEAHGFGLGMSVVRDTPALIASGRGAGSAGAFGWPGLFGGWWQADPAQDMVLLWMPEVLPGAPPKGAQMPRMPGFQGWVDLQRRAYSA